MRTLSHTVRHGTRRRRSACRAVQTLKSRKTRVRAQSSSEASHGADGVSRGAVLGCCEVRELDIRPSW